MVLTRCWSLRCRCDVTGRKEPELRNSWCNVWTRLYLWPHPGRLLSTYGLRLPYFAAAGFCLLNWVYGFFVLPESLPADRRSAIDFAKANPFTALMALTKVQGIAAWCGSLFLPPSLNSFCNRPGFSTQRFDSGWGPRKNGLSLFVVGIASAVGQTLLLGFLLTERWENSSAWSCLLFCRLR